MKKQGPAVPLAIRQECTFLLELAQERRVPQELAQEWDDRFPLAAARKQPVLLGLALEPAVELRAKYLHLKIQKKHTFSSSC